MNFNFDPIAEQLPPECATNSWSRWDECTTKCGPGKQYRIREFKNPALASVREKRIY